MAVTSKVFFTLSDAYRVQSIDPINDKTCKEKDFCHFIVWHNHISLNLPWLSSYYLDSLSSFWLNPEDDFQCHRGAKNLFGSVFFHLDNSTLNSVQSSLGRNPRGWRPDWLCTTHINSTLNEAERDWLISTEHKRYIKMYINTQASRGTFQGTWRTRIWWSSLGLYMNLFDILHREADFERYWRWVRHFLRVNPPTWQTYAHINQCDSTGALESHISRGPEHRATTLLQGGGQELIVSWMLFGRSPGSCWAITRQCIQY